PPAPTRPAAALPWPLITKTAPLAPIAGPTSAPRAARSTRPCCHAPRSSSPPPAPCSSTSTTPPPSSTPACASGSTSTATSCLNLRSRPMAVDPITREIMENALAAAADEMSLALYRTAYSTIVRDCLDYSTSLCDAQGQMIAQGITIPLHLGAVPAAMQALFA